MKNTLRFSLLLSLCFVAVSAHAQSGCADSPENPTAVLVLVGGAGAAITMLRDRWRRR